ncbi:helix-turn-helix domain-containing protein [Abyssalbus ytuae]|uniref:Helix-turn-helix domain-containing protein n=1 Tax=Abyssalbus ytuae TaxID=2926907 RepID=A0A9E6ZSN2_9FLAO|nr:helix-turn-helix domain-containing protein [Abyssalbus ytuae]UOB18123.1 helix-turn-helix domain-containing protein [Abyssalbus ytuae]
MIYLFYFEKKDSISIFEEMEFKFEILPVLMLLGSIQGIILSVLLFFYEKNNNKISNRILGVTVFLMSVNLLYAVFFTSGIILKFPYLIRTLDTLQVITPPLIFLYVLSLTRNNFKIQRTHYLYSLPFFLSTVYLLFTIGPVEERIAFYQNFVEGNISMSFKLLFLFKVLNGILFLIASFIELSKHTRLIPQLFENTANKKLVWLRNLLLFLLATWIIAIARPVLNFNVDSIYLLGIAVSVIIYLITVNQLKQQVIYSGISSDLIEDIKAKTHKKYKNSSLDHTELKEIFLKLDEYCRQEKPFLETECNLTFIAEKIWVKPNTLSQVLNIYAKKTYYEYLNDLKAEEAEKNLREKKYTMLTIDAIGELSGFRSKATFYTSFKNKYGVTPLEYRKKSGDTDTSQPTSQH